MTKYFYKCDPFNFVPFIRTPWAGKQISELKKKYLACDDGGSLIPEFIGESWEVSTDQQFPSKIEIEKDKFISLTDLITKIPENILGKKNFHKYGAHFPLLLKWLEANDLLSVQLHPSNSNSLLKENECGKPEAWFILNVENQGFVYLGFKEGLSKEDIIYFLKNEEPEKCLHKYYPKKFDYISVPPGCVHAVGPGVLVAEPQYVMPKKIAKTWRISDWKRLYDEQGKQSSTGKPREVHTEESFSSINWNLPQGKALEKLLIQNIKSNIPFLGDKNNPFALKVLIGAGNYCYSHLVKNCFSLFTVWGGKVTLSFKEEVIILKGGESGFIFADIDDVQVKLEDTVEQGCIGFFALNEEFS